MDINSFSPLFSSLAQENKLKILHTGTIQTNPKETLKNRAVLKCSLSTQITNPFFLFDNMNFNFRLELNGHRRRLTWEATPRSIHEGVSSAIMNSDCLVFDTTIAQLFADNGNLGINVTISMC